VDKHSDERSNVVSLTTPSKEVNSLS